MSSARIDRYVPLATEFAARAVMFHDSVARRLDLNVTDLKALRLLGTEPMTAGQLAEATELTGAAVTALVDRLEATGYVTRERDPEDRRRVTIRAVAAKLRKLDQLYAGQGAAMAALLAKYDDASFDVIADYLVNGAKILAEQTAKLRGTKAT
jgi:DNA-binding MarR family transcriptional regulator